MYDVRGLKASFHAPETICLILNMVDTKSSKLWLINPKGIAI
jgi:hypothetical protein